MTATTRQIDFSDLNPEQQEAVRTTQGRILILAGAGSGKTRVLTFRMAHLIGNLGVDPSNILGLTFTNKAAAEMRERIAQMVDKNAARKITLSTFHSFCMQILRKEIHRLGYTPKFTLYDEEDMRRLVTLIARDLLDHDSELPSVASVLAEISKARNQGLDPDQVEMSGDTWFDTFVIQCYQRLQAAMRAYDAIDFDGLLCLTVQLFREHPDILAKYQEQYQYIMIDEYQDTNPIQFQIVDLLAQKHQNLCVVGDDDQSIYGWRGADVRNILEFSDAKTIKLEQNYRSNNGILKAANAVIGNNLERHGKRLWSSRGEGDPIEIFHAPSDLSEAQAVVCRIAQLQKQGGYNWSDIAVLYRSNALSRQIELALMKHTWKQGDRWIKGIPYKIHGGLEFFRRKEVKDLLAYLRLIINPRDQQSILRVINQPRRGIGEAALDQLTQINRQKQVSLWEVLLQASRGETEIEGMELKLSSRARAGVENFVGVMQDAQKQFEEQPLSEAMTWLLDRVNFQRAIHEEVKSDKMRAIKWENCQELVSALAQYEMEEPVDGEERDLTHFLSTTSLDDSHMGEQEDKGPKDVVSLMTFHSSKGLEFPAVFLVGMEDQIIPHERSLKEGGLEEERRLMYVAITRAMRHLTCSMAQKRMKMGKPVACKPSRFLFEIPRELMRVTRWDQMP